MVFFFFFLSIVGFTNKVNIVFRVVAARREFTTQSRNIDFE